MAARSPLLLLSLLGLTSGTPPCARKGMGYKDPKHETINGGYVHSADVCQVTCQSMWYCEVFTYYPSTGACWLQGNQAVEQAIPDAISAPAVCTPPVSRLSLAMKSAEQAGRMAASRAREAGQSQQEQMAAAANAAQIASAGAGLSPELQAQLAAAAIGFVAADASALAGESLQQQADAAAAAAAASNASLSAAQPGEKAALAAAGVALRAAEASGKDASVQVNAAASAAQRAAAGAGLSAEEQAAQAGAAAAIVAALNGETSTEIVAAASAAAKQVAAAAGLAIDVQDKASSDAYAAAVKWLTGSFSTTPAETPEQVEAAKPTATATKAILDAAARAAASAQAAGKSTEEQADTAAATAKAAAAAAGFGFEEQVRLAAEAAGAAAAEAAKAAGQDLQMQAEVAAKTSQEYASNAGVSAKQAARVAAKAAGLAAADAVGDAGNTLQDGIDAASSAAKVAAKDVGMTLDQASKEGKVAEEEVKLKAGADASDHEGSSTPWLGWLLAVLVIGCVAAICFVGAAEMKHSKTERSKPKRGVELKESKDAEKDIEEQTPLMASERAKSSAEPMPVTLAGGFGTGFGSMLPQAMFMPAGVSSMPVTMPSLMSGSPSAAAYPVGGYSGSPRQLSYEEWHQQWQPGLPRDVMFEIPAGATQGAGILVEVEPGVLVPTVVPAGAYPGVMACLQR